MYKRQVVSDGVTVTTTDAQGIYQMRVKRNAPFVFVSVPAEYEIPVENGMPKIYKKIAMGDNDVVQRSFKLERTGKKERFTLLALADVQIGRDDEVTMLDEEVLPLLIPYVQQELEAPVYGISLGDLSGTTCPSTRFTSSVSERSACPFSRSSATTITIKP